MLRGYSKVPSESAVLGEGACFGLSETAWRCRILQAWLHGLLQRSTILGYGHGQMMKLVFNTYSVTEAANQFLESTPLPEVVLPSTKLEQLPPTASCDSEAPVKLIRKSKGTHLLPVLVSLLSSNSNWYEIKETDDYYYPGIFRCDHPQCLGFAPDISTFPLYSTEDKHFLFTDIQLSKGKLRAPRRITVPVNGVNEDMYYRIAPCGGMKNCPVEDCSYSICTREHHPCPKHPDHSLVLSAACPVEFVYAWPVCNDDKRRWLSGLVRRGEMVSNNLHNHAIPAPTKIPARVVNDIQLGLIAQNS